ncbi:hypothetical protein PBAC_05290 [Pedobacter glucosidilyticus]|uniref:DUF4199 domain-containing protein n=1 Tax=Pedobacter aquae TaxID=2605747 RepID=A0A5C0VIB2_9SPHI|nr:MULTISPECIES: DUF4199 domain-containing protein [Pedobacter]KHJ39216.1 hypothetical protein PBAC_05290 [Pedobacter glucosidilyticus]QEK51431.1 DUF4199 domain-containing protein [Pedobacter aquae]
MKELEVRPTKTASYWALLAFVMIVILTYVFYFAEVDQKSALNYITYIPFIACLALAIKNHKEKELDGYISFGRAFNTGFRFSSLLSLMMGLFMLVYLKWLNPDVLELGLVEAENQMLDQGQSSKQIDAAMSIARSWGPYLAAVTTAIMYTLTGAALSLVFAAIFKKEAPMFEESESEA